MEPFLQIQNALSRWALVRAWQSSASSLGRLVQYSAPRPLARWTTARPNAFSGSGFVFFGSLLLCIPTMLLFKNGKVAEQIVGMVPKASLQDKIKAQL